MARQNVYLIPVVPPPPLVGLPVVVVVVVVPCPSTGHSTLPDTHESGHVVTSRKSQSDSRVQKPSVES